MGFKERREAIRKLQDIRGSKVLVHFLSDRRVARDVPILGMITQLAGEAQPFIYDHLRLLGRTDKLDLVLHTRGGALDAVWPLVRLCRSMTGRFSVLVPMRALSAGTMICLGADEVIMGPAAELSPIDPTTANQFNPRDPAGNILPISVEDVTSYFDLAREDEEKGAGLKSDEHILEVFKALSSQVHPLALGNVKRVHSQIRQIAKRLLKLHHPAEEDEERIDRAVKALTEELYSHTHVINREEASEILGDDMVPVPSDKVEGALWELYQHYAELFDLGRTFNIKEWMGEAEERALEAVGAAIETEAMSHLFKATSMIRRVPEIPKGIQVQVPPGQRIPPIPGLPSGLNIEPISEGWYNNDEV